MQADDNYLQILAGKISLGTATRHDIYSVADVLVGAGDEDPSLMQILVLGPEARLEEIRPDFETFLRRKGIPVPPSRKAQLAIASVHASSFLRGEASALDAANNVCRDAVLYIEDEPSAFHEFEHWLQMAYFKDCTLEEAETNVGLLLREIRSAYETGEDAKWTLPS